MGSRIVASAWCALLCLSGAPLGAHQGAHPTGLETCDDTVLALDTFHLYGEGVVGSRDQPIFEPQSFRLVNTGAVGEIPRTEARIAFAIGNGHDARYSDFTVRVALPSGTYEANAANFQGRWVINPLLEGWSGTMLVTIQSDRCDLGMQAQATWNLPEPEWVRNPCDPCRNLTCRSGSAIGSVDLSVPVGVAHYGLEPVTLRYEAEALLNEGAAALSVEGPASDGPVVQTDEAGLLASVACGGQLAQVIREASPVDPNRFVVRVSSDQSDPAETVYRETVVENVTQEDGTNVLQFTETVAGRTSTRYYVQPDAGTWVLVEDDLRRTTKRRLSETAEARVTRWKTEEWNTNGDWALVEVRDEHEKRYSWGWMLEKLVLDPDGKALTSTWDYYAHSEFSGPNDDTSGRGRLQRETLPTGLVREFEYWDSDRFDDTFNQVEIVREAFAGNPLTLERRRHLAVTSSDRHERHETWVEGTLIERTEIRARSAGGTNWITESRYPSADAEPLVTRVELDPSPSNPLLQTTYHPDGTLEQIHVREEGGLKIVTTYRGVANPGPGFPILVGEESREVLNAAGQMIQSETCAIRHGTLYPLEMRLATEFDELQRPTVIGVYHSGAVAPTFVATQEFGCCGVSSRTGQDGLTTTTFFDALGRLRKVHRNGLSTETVYDGLTVRTHLYPEETATAASLAEPDNELANATRNLAGDLIAEQSRAPHDGSLVTTTHHTAYHPGGGVGRRVVRTLPSTPDDLGVVPAITEEFYLDGTLKRRTGPPVVDRLFTPGFTAAGRTSTIALLAQDGTPREPVTTQLDWMGRALKVTYASDADEDGTADHEQFAYDAAGRLSRHVDADGVTRLTRYAPAEETVRVVLDLNQNATVNEDVDEIRITREGVATDPEGRTIMWTERSVQDTDENGEGVEHLVSRHETSADLLASWTHLLRGGETTTSHRTTEYFPDPVGSWDLSIRQPDGTVLRQEYRAGLLAGEELLDRVGASLLTRSFRYDEFQRLRERHDTSAPAIGQNYVAPLVDQPANLSIGARTTVFKYDARGRRILTDEPDTVDATGQPVANRQMVSYWPHGAVREVTGDPGYRRSFTYDFAHRLATLTTYGTHQATTRWEYDPQRGWLNGKRYNSPNPGTGTGSRYSYTPAGRLASRTNARGIVTAYGRGADGRLDGTTYSDGTPGLAIHARDRRGRITRLTDAGGTRVLRYDAQDELIATEHEPGSLLAGWTVRQPRDASGRLAALELQRDDATAHHLAYRYNDAGQLGSVSGGGLVAHYTYHPTRQLVAQVGIADERRPLHFATRQYDALNRLARITYHNGNLQGAFRAPSDFAYKHDDFGRITHATLRGGTQWRYRYHRSGEIASARRHLSPDDSSAVLAGQSFVWEFDAIGNRISAARESSEPSLRIVSYQPNALNQPTRIDTPGLVHVSGTAPSQPAVLVNGEPADRQGVFFHRDLAVDNSAAPVLLPVSVTQGTSQQSGAVLVPPAEVVPEHDADGNITSDGVHRFRWDAEDRLVEIEVLPAAVAAGVDYQRVAFTYDSSSRCLQRLRYDQPAPAEPVATTRYLHAGWRRLGELDGAGELIRTYAWGLDNDDRLHLGDSNAALLWLHDHLSGETHLATNDGNGNVTGLVSASTGKPAASYHYSPFGQLLTSTGPYAEQNPFRFSTKPFEPVGEIYNYGLRHYRPATGSWLSRDPIAEDGGLNVYGFLGNEPVNDYDLLGRQGFGDWMARQVAGARAAAGAVFRYQYHELPRNIAKVAVAAVNDIGTAIGNEVNYATHSYYDYGDVWSDRFSDAQASLAHLAQGLAYDLSDPDFLEKLLADIGSIEPECIEQFLKQAHAEAAFAVLTGGLGRASAGTKLARLPGGVGRSNPSIFSASSSGTLANKVQASGDHVGRRLGRLGYNDENVARILEAIDRKDNVVIVGENMRRVRAIANMVESAGGRSVTYSPRNFTGVNRNGLEANRSWLRYWAKEKRATVIDIGYQPVPRPTGPSLYYALENRSLRKWGIYTPIGN